MTDRAVLAVGWTGFALAAIAQWRLMAVMHRYRVDIDPTMTWLGGGRSWSWQGNVFRPSNYSTAGKRLLPWLVLCVLTQVGFLVFLLWL